MYVCHETRLDNHFKVPGSTHICSKNPKLCAAARCSRCSPSICRRRNQLRSQISSRDGAKGVGGQEELNANRLASELVLSAGLNVTGTQ